MVSGPERKIILPAEVARVLKYFVKENVTSLLFALQMKSKIISFQKPVQVLVVFLFLHNKMKFILSIPFPKCMPWQILVVYP